MSENRSILHEHNGRYMCRVHSAPATVRYEIRERRGDGPSATDVLIFWTHSPSAADIHWERIKDIPVRRKKTPWIEW